MNRWGLWASGVAGAAVAAVAWRGGIAPPLFWGGWVATAVVIVSLRLTIWRGRD